MINEEIITAENGVAYRLVQGGILPSLLEAACDFHA
jgi:hypothetical protein